MIVLFWVAAFALGAGFTYAANLTGLSFLRGGASSPMFMILSLFIIMLIYQARMNLMLPRTKNALFVFAPPTPTILGEIAAFFGGSFLIQSAYTVS